MPARASGDSFAARQPAVVDDFVAAEPDRGAGGRLSPGALRALIPGMLLPCSKMVAEIATPIIRPAGVNPTEAIWTGNFIFIPSFRDRQPGVGAIFAVHSLQVRIRGTGLRCYPPEGGTSIDRKEEAAAAVSGRRPRTRRVPL